MSTRRTFLKNVSALGIGAPLAGDCLVLANKEFSWSEIADMYYKDKGGRLNFNTGSAGMMPIPIYNKYVGNTKLMASYAPYEVKEASKANVTQAMFDLSVQLGTKAQELALVRNTTEGINHVLYNYPFLKEDEVIISNMAYPFPHYTLDILENIKGINKVQVILDPQNDTDQDIVRKFESAITKKTKLILATYMTHREGLIMPVKDICKMAHAKDIEVLLDGAHIIGQIDHNLSQVDCDYYVTSLHKWMSAPLGTGLLFIKEKLIEKINPSYSFPMRLSHSMDKFDFTGTIAFQNAMTLPTVLEFQNLIGIQRKEARLRELASYLAEGLSKIPEVKVRMDEKRSCGIIAFEIKTLNYKKAVERYKHDHAIHCKTVTYMGDPFIRASVNLHLLKKDLDRFIEATRIISTR